MSAVNDRLWIAEESDAPDGGLRSSFIAWAILACMILVFAVTFSFLAVLRHRAYQSHAFDLGNMDQAVWNTLHGRPFRFTDMQVGRAVLTSRLAIHVEPLLLVLAPLYLFHGGPETLLITQAVVVASGAVPAYLLARDRLKSVYLSLVFPAAYLLHPSLQNALLDDFHAVVLSGALLMWALLFAVRGNIRPFLLVSLVAIATKEEVALLVAAMSLLLLRRDRVVAILTFGASIAWFLVCVDVIIPAFNPAGHSPYLARYRYLGRGLPGILGGALGDPAGVARVLTSRPRLDYLDALMHSLGWTSLLGLPILLLTLPSLAINMLSSDPTMYSGFYQYSADVVPFVVASSAIGVGLASQFAARKTVGHWTWIPGVLCLFVLTASVVDAYRYGFTPLAEGYAIPSLGPHQRTENAFLRDVPVNAVVSAADEIEPHMSGRPWVYLLPTVHPSNGPRADYIIVDASIPSLPTRPRTLARVVSRALRTGYGVRAARDGLLVLRYGSPRKTLPASFYSFASTHNVKGRAVVARWGGLQLATFTLHPRSRLVTRSRPAISVDTTWNVRSTLDGSTRLALYCSPVYRGRSPSFSPGWVRIDDGPTLAWLPPPRWRRNRSMRVSFLPAVPDVHSRGSVDVAIGVLGNGQVETKIPGNRVRGDRFIVRLATVRVGY